MLIAQISDLHLRADGSPLIGGVDTVAALTACVEHVNGLAPRPDVVLATGDLVDEGRPEDFAALRRAFDRLAMPVYVIPGNHDDRDGLRGAFADSGALLAEGEFLHYAVETFPVRLIGLDTVIPGECGGRMCEARTRWLDDRLAEQPDRPTLVFMHHPPFVTGIGFMDDPAFDGADRLERVVRGHPQVRQVVCGHIHRAIHTRWAGTAAAVAPSVVFQMALELSEGAPSACVLEPPAVSLYLWRDGTDPVGYTSLIGGYGPRHRFHPDDQDSDDG
jgi:3',5'-cyclic AMP phosphodiesterase CpdA